MRWQKSTVIYDTEIISGIIFRESFSGIILWNYFPGIIFGSYLSSVNYHKSGHYQHDTHKFINTARICRPYPR